ncbi:hypothetical protein MMC17_002386 [Xylographa soralifera]|nr:hypothetical protein [Xylographa soralifera]
MKSGKGGFHDDNYIQNFAKSSLAELEMRGLAPCPMVSLNRRDVSEKHLVCFPCTIVEIKHHKVSQVEIDKCYCQAANGAAASLVMLNKLARYSIVPGEHETIRTVVSFTFIGYQARVWIAYISDKSQDNSKGREQCTYDMQCIWEGSIRRNLDTVQLCCIIENLQFWILKHFRPWVSSCLDRWYYPGLEAIEHHGEGEIEEDSDEESEKNSEDDVEDDDEDDDEEVEEDDDLGEIIDEETTEEEPSNKASSSDESGFSTPSIKPVEKRKVNGKKVNGKGSVSSHDSTGSSIAGAKRSPIPSSRGPTTAASSPGKKLGKTPGVSKISLNLPIRGSQGRPRARSAEPRS